MQIDFHHGVTYIVARLAGFDADRARVIAHSSQYVDDATNAGTIHFDNGAQYTRIASAHKMLDYANVDILAEHFVWLPFHFLPGNLGEPAPAKFVKYESAEYLERCVTFPNSPVAQEMMRDVVRRQDRPYGLHRLGIASHVYIDTWAHQGFVGYKHRRNRVHSVVTDEHAHMAQSLKTKLKVMFQGLWDEATSGFVDHLLPLGHGAALGFPDHPYLIWSYINGLNEPIKRNNPEEFSQAVRELYQFYKRFLEYGALRDEAVFHKTYDIPKEFALIDAKLRSVVSEDPQERHDKWMDAIHDGEFGFREFPKYVDKGVGSWKHAAVGAIDADGDVQYDFKPEFLTSNWKLFHDALQAHRLAVLNELLPRFGLSAA